MYVSMNRQIVSCEYHGARGIAPDSTDYSTQVKAWTQRLLAKEPALVPDGQVFRWGTSSGTSYLFDAVMCNIQYAQHQLQRSSSSAGKHAYATALDAATTYAYVLQELLPKWTFQPALELPDASHQDIYGHYCLARAMAYNAVGKADLTCTDAARQAAAANASHMYVMAAQLIGGKTAQMLRCAQANVAGALVTHGDRLLAKWDSDEDSHGASTALACYREAQERFISADMAGCQDKIDFAYERNQVHWLEPVLPDFPAMVRARITGLARHSQEASVLSVSSMEE